MARAILLVDLGFGDAGKGTTTDALVKQTGARLVVRYNGGPQAAHNVVTDDGRHHEFHQFGSGTFHPGCRTLLARAMKVSPLALMNEAEALEAKGVIDPLSLVYVDRACLMVTPYHRALNRLREMSRGVDRHGSCGMGVGETQALFLEQPELALRVGDIEDLEFPKRFNALRKALARKAVYLPVPFSGLPAWDEQMDTFSEAKMQVYLRRYEEFDQKVKLVHTASALNRIALEDTIFEGSQGVLLDEDYGFHPYTTWSHTTLKHANELVLAAGVEDVVRLGIQRSYMVRHGEGPFPTYSPTLTELRPESHNGPSPWQREMRCGWRDGVLDHYAHAVVGKLDGLVLTHMDAFKPVKGGWQMCVGYQDPTVILDTFKLKDRNDLVTRTALTARLALVVPILEPMISVINRGIGPRVPVLMESRGPKTGDKTTFDFHPRVSADPVGADAAR